MIAVERGHLDGDDVFDLGEATPERVGQDAAADAGLQIEANDRQHLGHGTAVGDAFILGGGRQRAETEESGVVAEFAQQFGFTDGLRCGSADAADADEGFS